MHTYSTYEYEYALEGYTLDILVSKAREKGNPPQERTRKEPRF
jgi:hypothetical protein